MKTVLLPTDFTDTDLNASKYGLHLAQSFGASVHLFHAFQVITGAAFDAPIYQNAVELKRESMDQLLDAARNLNAEHLPSFYIDCREGPVVPSILEKAMEVHADLLVAGMKTDHKTFRKLIGSTVTDLATRSTIPVLIVPSGATFRQLATIALAIDADLNPESNPHMLDTLREIADRFNADVYVVTVKGDNIKDAFGMLHRPYRVMHMIRSTDPLFETISAKSVEEGLTQFVVNYHVDMLGIIPHKHSVIEKVFKQSVTRELIYQSHIPLLILPELAEKTFLSARVEGEVIL